jgi:phenylalanyl-tRNA synthetase beta chain
MKLPLAWLQDYLPGNLRGEEFTGTLAAACQRWDLKPERTDADTLGKLFTFAGFNCDGVENGAQGPALILDVLSNRPDAQCVLGLAREAAAILRVPLKAPDVPQCKDVGKKADEEISVCVEEPALCPRYTARVIRGVKVGPSPAWLQQRLQSMGLQPRNNIVDVTNFVLFEMNQPLHAFDLAGLAGKKIIVRRAQDKEPFAPLYGEVPPLTPETLVIADGEKPRAIAGVLGGKGSEVTPATTNILLEAAYFNPANTRRTVRRLKVMDGKGTDSSYRFERGIDLENVEHASARAAALIVEVAGGTLAPGVVDVRTAPAPARSLTLRLKELRRVFGAEIPHAEAERILQALGCEVLSSSDDSLSVRPPTWRTTDLLREIDLIEELARLYGYNHLPDVTRLATRIAPRSARERAAARLRGLFTAMGYFETVSDSLVDPRLPALPVWTATPPFKLDPSSVLREDHSVLRNCLLSSLLTIRKHNQDQRTGEARLFELNTVFLPGEGPRPAEKPVLALCDDRGFRTLADALSRIDEALELDGAHLRLSRPLQKPPAFLHPAESCRILRVRETVGHERAEDVIGWMGTLAPELQKAFDLRQAPAVCELDLLALANLPSAPRVYAPLPSFPEIARDIAIVVDDVVAWSEIEGFARDWQRGEPLRDAREVPRFLSVFRGKQIGAGKKSVAFSLVYRAADRTLTDDEVNPAHQKFVDALLKRFNAAIRA